MLVDVAKLFKFKTLDRATLKSIFEPLSKNISECVIWVPSNQNNYAYLAVHADNENVYDTLINELSAINATVDEVNEIQTSFDYTKIYNIFL